MSSFSHRGITVYGRSQVYHPREDTFFFLDVLDKIEQEEDLIPHQKAADVGTGTGILGLHVAKHLNYTVYASDVNPVAIECANSNAKINKITKFQVKIGAFFEPWSHEAKFDLIISNPPYVPSAPNEIQKYPDAVAWAGGLFGQEVILKLIAQLHKRLTDRGRALVLVSSFNRIMDIDFKKFKLGMNVVNTRKVEGEILSIICLTKNL